MSWAGEDSKAAYLVRRAMKRIAQNDRIARSEYVAKRRIVVKALALKALLSPGWLGFLISIMAALLTATTSLLWPVAIALVGNWPPASLTPPSLNDSDREWVLRGLYDFEPDTVIAMLIAAAILIIIAIYASWSATARFKIRKGFLAGDAARPAAIGKSHPLTATVAFNVLFLVTSIASATFALRFCDMGPMLLLAAPTTLGAYFHFWTLIPRVDKRGFWLGLIALLTPLLANAIAYNLGSSGYRAALLALSPIAAGCTATAAASRRNGWMLAIVTITLLGNTLGLYVPHTEAGYTFTALVLLLVFAVETIWMGAVGVPTLIAHPSLSGNEKRRNRPNVSNDAKELAPQDESKLIHEYIAIDVKFALFLIVMQVVLVLFLLLDVINITTIVAVLLDPSRRFLFPPLPPS